MSEIRISVENDICSVTLHNPERRNAISQHMWLQIREFAESDIASSARVIVLNGEGTDAFSAGADVIEFRRDRSDPSACSAYDGLVEYVPVF